MHLILKDQDILRMSFKYNDKRQDSLSFISQIFHIFQCPETRNWEPFKLIYTRVIRCRPQTSSISKIWDFVGNAKSPATSLTKRVQPRNLCFNKPLMILAWGQIWEPLIHTNPFQLNLFNRYLLYTSRGGSRTFSPEGILVEKFDHEYRTLRWY